MSAVKVLIIEDDRELSEELADLLGSEGYSVDAASDGIEGKSLADSGDYSLVLLDLKLPLMDGSDILCHIKERCQAHVIVITGKLLKGGTGGARVRDKTIDFTILETADGILEKPFDVERLMDTVRRLAPLSGDTS
jgi:DNA-binding response OmpR family regulator